MCQAKFDNQVLDAEIQRVNADGTVRLFVYNVGFINDVRVIRDGEREQESKTEDGNREG